MSFVVDLHISNSDFWILASILSAIGGIGIYEGMELHPVFYAQPTVIFGGLGYFAFKAFYLDRQMEMSKTPLSSAS